MANPPTNDTMNPLVCQAAKSLGEGCKKHEEGFKIPRMALTRRKAVKRLTVFRGIGVVGCTLTYRAVLDFLGLFDVTGFFEGSIIKKLLHFSFKRVIIVA